MTNVTLDRVRQLLAGRPSTRITEPDAARAAVALILVPGPGSLEALFIRRAQAAGDPWSGHVALPGGRWQLGDADLLQTAMREAREETGVRLDAGLLLGELDDFTPRTAGLPAIVIRPFVFGIQTRPDLIASPEVAYHRWIPLSGLHGSRTVVDVRGTPTEVLAYVMGNDVIWGLTERILSPFLELAD